MFDLRKPMIANDGLFAHKTLINPRLKAIQTVVAHLIRCSKGGRKTPWFPCVVESLPSFSLCSKRLNHRVSWGWLTHRNERNPFVWIVAGSACSSRVQDWFAVHEE